MARKRLCTFLLVGALASFGAQLFAQTPAQRLLGPDEDRRAPLTRNPEQARGVQQTKKEYHFKVGNEDDRRLVSTMLRIQQLIVLIAEDDEAGVRDMRKFQEIKDLAQKLPGKEKGKK